MSQPGLRGKGKNPMKGNWCTARECKDMRALATEAKKQAKLAKTCAAVGRPVPAAQPTDDGQCFWRVPGVGYGWIFRDILGYSGIYKHYVFSEGFD